MCNYRQVKEEVNMAASSPAVYVRVPPLREHVTENAQIETL
jgi:hypothetical protein